MIIALLLFPLLLFACTSQESKASIEIQCNDFYENTHITNSIEAADALRSKINADVLVVPGMSSGFVYAVSHAVLSLLHLAEPGIHGPFQKSPLKIGQKAPA